jgi:hypothetical protein
MKKLAFALLFFLGASLSAADSKPNIIVVVADDLGYADVLFNPLHPKEIQTPHLDSLAKQSVICRQGYVSGHVCSPTRAGLMTGTLSAAARALHRGRGRQRIADERNHLPAIPKARRLRHRAVRQMASRTRSPAVEPGIARIR